MLQGHCKRAVKTAAWRAAKLVTVIFTLGNRLQVYGGVNNLTNAQPYLASSAFPVSGIGRYFFLGAKTNF